MSERFLPPTEQEVRESIAKIFSQRAVEAAWWGEEFTSRNMPESADNQRVIQSLWNLAAEIALGTKKE